MKSNSAKIFLEEIPVSELKKLAQDAVIDGIPRKVVKLSLKKIGKPFQNEKKLLNWIPIKGDIEDNLIIESDYPLEISGNVGNGCSITTTQNEGHIQINGADNKSSEVPALGTSKIVAKGYVFVVGKAADGCSITSGEDSSITVTGEIVPDNCTLNSKKLRLPKAKKAEPAKIPLSSENLHPEVKTPNNPIDSESLLPKAAAPTNIVTPAPKPNNSEFKFLRKAEKPKKGATITSNKNSKFSSKINVSNAKGSEEDRKNTVEMTTSGSESNDKSKVAAAEKANIIHSSVSNDRVPLDALDLASLPKVPEHYAPKVQTGLTNLLKGLKKIEKNEGRFIDGSEKKLRPFQQERLTECAKAMVENTEPTKDLVFESATGTGKTVMFSTLIANLIPPNSPQEDRPKILTLVPLKAIAKQTKNKLKETAPHLNVQIYSSKKEQAKLKGNHKKDDPYYHADVIIATHNTLDNTDKVQKFFPNPPEKSKFDFVIVDEAHRITSKKRWSTYLKFIKGKTNVWGFTATPGYDEEKTIYKMFGYKNPEDNPIKKVPLLKAIEEEYLAPVRTRVVDIDTMRDLQESLNKLQERGDEEAIGQLINKEEFNLAAVKVYCTGRDPVNGQPFFGMKTIVPCAGIKHAEDMAKLFNKIIKVEDHPVLKRKQKVFEQLMQSIHAELQVKYSNFATKNPDKFRMLRNKRKVEFYQQSFQEVMENIKNNTIPAEYQEFYDLYRFEVATTINSASYIVEEEKNTTYQLLTLAQKPEKKDIQYISEVANAAYIKVPNEKKGFDLYYINKEENICTKIMNFGAKRQGLFNEKFPEASANGRILNPDELKSITEITRHIRASKTKVADPKIKKARRGGLLLAMGSNMLKEGLDVPATQLELNWSGTASILDRTQELGRIERLDPDTELPKIAYSVDANFGRRKQQFASKCLNNKKEVGEFKAIDPVIREAVANNKELLASVEFFENSNIFAKAAVKSIYQVNEEIIANKLSIIDSLTDSLEKHMQSLSTLFGDLAATTKKPKPNLVKTEPNEEQNTTKSSLKRRSEQPTESSADQPAKKLKVPNDLTAKHEESYQHDLLNDDQIDKLSNLTSLSILINKQFNDVFAEEIIFKKEQHEAMLDEESDSMKEERNETTLQANPSNKPNTQKRNKPANASSDTLQSPELQLVISNMRKLQRDLNFLLTDIAAKQKIVEDDETDNEKHIEKRKTAINNIELQFQKAFQLMEEMTRLSHSEIFQKARRNVLAENTVIKTPVPAATKEKHPVPLSKMVNKNDTYNENDLANKLNHYYIYEAKGQKFAILVFKTAEGENLDTNCKALQELSNGFKILGIGNTGIGRCAHNFYIIPYEHIEGYDFQLKTQLRSLASEQLYKQKDLESLDRALRRFRTNKFNTPPYTYLAEDICDEKCSIQAINAARRARTSEKNALVSNYQAPIDVGRHNWMHKSNKSANTPNSSMGLTSLFAPVINNKAPTVTGRAFRVKMLENKKKNNPVENTSNEKSIFNNLASFWGEPSNENDSKLSTVNPIAKVNSYNSHASFPSTSNEDKYSTSFQGCYQPSDPTLGSQSFYQPVPLNTPGPMPGPHGRSSFLPKGFQGYYHLNTQNLAQGPQFFSGQQAPRLPANQQNFQNLDPCDSYKHDPNSYDDIIDLEFKDDFQIRKRQKNS